MCDNLTHSRSHCLDSWDPAEHLRLVRDHAEHFPLVRDPAEHFPLVREPIEHFPLVRNPAEHFLLVRDPAEHFPLVRGPAEHFPLVRDPAEHFPLVRNPIRDPAEHLCLANTCDFRTLERFKRSWLATAADIRNDLPGDMILQGGALGWCTVLKDIQHFVHVTEHLVYIIYV